MKKLILLTLFRNFKTQPRFRRKVKIFAAFALVAALITCALLVWAGISASMYVASKAQEVIESPQTSAQVEKHVDNIKTEVTSFSNFRPLDCWNKAQTLFAVQPWIQIPVADNLRSLKDACVESPAAG